MAKKKEEQKPVEGAKKGKKKIAYSVEIARKICIRIQRGESLRSICAEKEMPSISGVMNWLLDEDKEAFQKMYDRAREVRAELMFEEIEEIADEAGEVIVGDDKSDNARVAAVRLRVDTRKWVLGRMSPKKFGDKLDLSSGGKALREPRAVTINYIVPQTV